MTAALLPLIVRGDPADFESLRLPERACRFCKSLLVLVRHRCEWCGAPETLQAPSAGILFIPDALWPDDPDADADFVEELTAAMLAPIVEPCPPVRPGREWR